MDGLGEESLSLAAGAMRYCLACCLAPTRTGKVRTKRGN